MKPPRFLGQCSMKSGPSKASARYGWCGCRATAGNPANRGGLSKTEAQDGAVAHLDQLNEIGTHFVDPVAGYLFTFVGEDDAGVSVENRSALLLTVSRIDRNTIERDSRRRWKWRSQYDRLDRRRGARGRTHAEAEGITRRLDIARLLTHAGLQTRRFLLDVYCRF